MTENFDREFKILFRDIYYSHDNKIIHSVMSFLNYVIMNEEIISNHKYKENIKKIIDKEIEKIVEIRKIYNLYSEKIKIILDDSEYDIIN
jgi:hypothetical protein